MSTHNFRSIAPIRAMQLEFGNRMLHVTIGRKAFSAEIEGVRVHLQPVLHFLRRVTIECQAEHCSALFTPADASCIADLVHDHCERARLAAAARSRQIAADDAASVRIAERKASLRASLVSDFQRSFPRSTFMTLEALLGWPRWHEMSEIKDETLGSLSVVARDPAAHVSRHNLQWARQLLRKRGFITPAQKRLTVRQTRAAISQHRNVRIVASAGTGKTLTLAGRVEHLVNFQGVAPKEILLLSFTRKAVAEMRTRLEAAGIRGVTVATFHGLGNYIRRRAGIPNKRISKLTRRRRLEKFINRFIDGLLKEPATNRDLMLFLSIATHPFMEQSDAIEPGHYYKHLRTFQRRTLRDDVQDAPDSQEECMIADFLYLHGVDYAFSEYCTLPGFWKSYKPDFQLRDAQGNLVILEFFGVTRELRPNAVCGREYVAKVKAKLEYFKNSDVTFIAAYSGDFSKPSFFDDLRRDLERAGVRFHEVKNEKEIIAALQRRGECSRLAKTIQAFHCVARSKREAFEDIAARAVTWRERTFMAIYERFVREYERYLAERNEQDFEHMIERSINALAEGSYAVPWSHVLVDEYQDVADIQIGLLQELRRCRNFDLCVVGDHRQSIYSFRGSDPRALEHFEQHFGSSDTYALEVTFRSNSAIIAVASGVIDSGSRSALNTRLRARRAYGPRVWLYDIREDLREQFPHVEAAKRAAKALAIKVAEASGGDCLILGRNADHLPDLDHFQDRAMTMHAAKGLEASQTCLLGFYDGWSGFPSKRPHDHIMDLVQTQDNSLLAEVRLLFVALTRAFDEVHVLIDADRPSEFALLLRHMPGTAWVGEVDPLRGRIMDCPTCGKWGHLRLSRHYRAYYCSNRGRCRESRPACPVQGCHGIVDKRNTRFFKCLRCSRLLTRCINRGCKTGYLVYRATDDMVCCSRANATMYPCYAPAREFRRLSALERGGVVMNVRSDAAS